MVRVPCRYCREEIEAGASECPHCGEKKWTKSRRNLYLGLYLPLVSMVLGLGLYELFQSAGPYVTTNWLLGLIGGVYVLGAIMTVQYHRQYRDHISNSTS